MKKEKNNILIIGANGFVGKSLTKRFLKDKYNLFLVSRNKKIKINGAKIFYGDLTNQSFCKKIVSNVNTVFYLAGYKKNIAYHTKYPNDFVFGNIEPLISFLKAAKKSSIKKIVYLSSTNVGLYKEGEEDGYVVGKYINEIILKSFSKQSDIDVKIVRAPGVYGPGDNFDLETANFIPSMINKIYKSDKEVSVWGTGKRKIQFIFIEDLVSNLVAIFRSLGKFFVIGNRESLTINDIVKNIIKLLDKDLVIKNDLTKPDKQTKLFKFHNEKKPEFDFDKGLEATINYYKNIKKI